MRAQTETCANCGTEIGRLEQPYLWQNDVVCRKCYDRLAGVSSPVSAAAPPPVPEVSPRPQPFLGGAVWVSPTQLTIHSTAYSLLNIASVSRSSQFFRGTRNFWPGVIVIVLSLAIFGFSYYGRDEARNYLSTYAGFSGSEQYKARQRSLVMMTTMLYVTPATAALGVVLLFYFGGKRSPDRALFSVTVTANSGDAHSVHSSDGREVNRFLAALRSAMAEIGSKAVIRQAQAPADRTPVRQ